MIVSIPYRDSKSGLQYALTITVLASGVVDIYCPVTGNVRLTEVGWDDLVQQVNEAFVAEPRVELEIGNRDEEEDRYAYHAPEEMARALSELPTQEVGVDGSYFCRFCDSKQEHRYCHVDLCSNCGLNRRKGHEPHCMAW